MIMLMRARLQEFVSFGRIKIGWCNMSKISKEDKRALFREGWLPFEIDLLQKAKTPSGATQSSIPISGKAWAAVRRSRIRYVAGLRRDGWSADEIKMKISNYYKGKTRGSAVFDWIKASYRRPPPLKNFYEGVQRRAYKHSKVSDEWQRGIARKELTNKMGYYRRHPGRVAIVHRMPARPMVRRIKRKVV